MARPLPSRLDRCVSAMEIMMRRVLIAAMQAALFGCVPGFAQVDGATELASPGLGLAPAGTMGMTGNGTTCLATGSPSLGMSGSSTYFDGGGTGVGTGTFRSRPRAERCGIIHSVSGFHHEARSWAVDCVQLKTT
jgi:hypothetical protein